MFSKSLLLILALTSCVFSFSQEVNQVDTNVYTQPEYPGGKEEMYAHIEEQFQVKFPNYESINSLGEQFTVRFQIDKYGNMLNFKLTYSTNHVIDAYIKDIFYEMESWTPGTINGEKGTIQLQFKLEIKPVLNEGGYIVEENNYTYAPHESTKLLRTVIVAVSIAVMIFLFFGNN